MSTPKKHYRLINKSRKILKEAFPKVSFPSNWKMNPYTTLINPDVVHIIRHINQNTFNKFNHLYAKNYKGALKKAKFHYKKLVKKLSKNKKAGFNATWLAHFIQDILEPMHHTTYRTGNLKKSFTRTKKHLWVEEITSYSKLPQTVTIDKITGTLEDYLKTKAEKIDQLQVEKLDYNDKKKILAIYENNITKEQIQATVSLWYKALQDAKLS